MILAVLFACQADKQIDSAISDEKDLDGDGFIGWRWTTDPEIADCDDQDDSITPDRYRYIAKGVFTRGDSRGENATPQKEIMLQDYCIDRFERSNQDFVSFLNIQSESGLVNQDEAGRQWYDIDDNDDEYPARITVTDNVFQVVEGYEDHPVVEVYHWAGIDFCLSLGMRLPTEAEWEKAARGSDGRTYPWGEAEPNCDLANYWPRNGEGLAAERCVDDTLPNNALEAGQSPYGIYNMSGNVSEWSLDYFLADHYENAADSNPSGPERGWHVDPLHPDGFEAIVARGGSLGTGSGSLRTFHRSAEPSDATSNGMGFRCVFEPR